MNRKIFFIMVFGLLCFGSIYSVYRLIVSLDHSEHITLKGWGNDFFDALGDKPSAIKVPSPPDKEGWEEVDTLSPKNIYPSPKPS
jgi:hypothetical protein